MPLPAWGSRIGFESEPRKPTILSTAGSYKLTTGGGQLEAYRRFRRTPTHNAEALLSIIEAAIRLDPEGRERRREREALRDRLASMTVRQNEILVLSSRAS